MCFVIIGQACGIKVERKPQFAAIYFWYGGKFAQPILWTKYLLEIMVLSRE